MSGKRLPMPLRELIIRRQHANRCIGCARKRKPVDPGSKKRCGFKEPEYFPSGFCDSCYWPASIKAKAAREGKALMRGVNLQIILFKPRSLRGEEGR